MEKKEGEEFNGETEECPGVVVQKYISYRKRSYLIPRLMDFVARSGPD